MSAPVVLVFVPGLSRGLLDGGAMPLLRGLLPVGRRAGLVCGFPSLPDSVEATALRGQLPLRHRLRLAGDLPSTAHPSIAESLAARAPGQLLDLGSDGMPDPAGFGEAKLVLWRRPAMLEATRSHGAASDARLEEAARVDAELHELWANALEGTRLMIFGGPGLRPVQRCVRLPEEATGSESTRESAVLRVRVSSRAQALDLRRMLLDCRGVERVLRGEALESWGAGAASEENELYALAGRGWSFVEESASVGHPELDDEESPVLIALGSTEGRPWPPELHDHRLAPSLASALDLPEEPYLDRAYSL